MEDMNTCMCPSAGRRRKPPHLSFYEKTHLGGHAGERGGSKLLLYIWNKIDFSPQNLERPALRCLQEWD